MKRSHLFLCIAFAVICLLRRSEESLSDYELLCSKDERTYRILSAFNLKDDLIIQGQENGADTSEFWKVSKTEGEIQKSVSKDMFVSNFAHVWLGTFIPSRKDLNTGDDIYSADDIDLSKRIFGYIAPINTDYWEDCKNQTSPIKMDDKGCKIIAQILNNNDEDFVCIHGTLNDTINNVSTNVFYWNSHDGSLNHIMSQPLRDLVTRSCVTHSSYMSNIRPNVTTKKPSRVTSFVNWPLAGYRSDIFANISFVYFESPTEANKTSLLRLETVIVDNTTEIKSFYIEGYNPKSHYFLFRFNQYYKYIVCGEDCLMGHYLTWLIWNETRNAFNVQYTSIKLKSLLACEYPFIEFEPNQFCQNENRFQSIFNLGKDIYFQFTGRFWRYPFNRFREVKPSNGINKYNIRLESEFAAQLERTGIDTLHPTHGLTFIPRKSSYCRSRDNDCHKAFTDSGQYFTACLFGLHYFFNTITNSMLASVALQTYYYTPGGLTPLRHEVQATRTFCANLLSYNKNNVMTFASLHNSTDKNIVYAQYYKHSKTVEVGFDEPAETILVQIEWPVNADLGNTSPKKIELFKAKDFYKILFFFHVSINGEEIKGYGYDHTNITYTLFKDNKYEPSTETNNLFGCPFHSGYSLVSINKEKVCPRHKTYSAESVFTIGPYVYHQMGQNFYMFNGKRFIYDRDSSDILNDYFDTKHRVTGFSYPIKGVVPHQFNVYEVMIHGKSAERYHHLGDYIFVIFKYDKNVPYLQIVNDPAFSILMINKTLGAISPFGGTTFINHMCGVISSEKEVFIWYWVREDRRIWKYYTFDDMEFLRVLRDPNKPKHQLANSRWKKYNVDMEKVPIQGILGCYTDWPTNKILFVAQSRADKQEWVYEAVTNPGRVEIKDIGNFKKTDKFYSWTCDADDSESKSSDSGSSSKTLNTIFSVLLLLLMVLALLIAYFVYQKNQKSGGIPKPNAEPNVDTLDPNRPNYTVVRQPPPKAESNSIAESSAEKSVRSEKI